MLGSLVVLRKERDAKLSEISVKEREISVLAVDIQELETEGTGKEAEVRRIEKMLEAKYADFRRQHPIDRGQEPEITRFVSRMNSSVSAASSLYDSRARSELNAMRHASFSSMRDPKMTPYKNRLRDMVKNHIEELKRLFDEVDSATERFCKNGISLPNMQSLIHIMEKIWDEGESVTVAINSQDVAKGSMPVRYKSKIDKWKTAARDIPEDIEGQDKEREASAKKIAQDKLSSVQADVSKLEKELSVLQSDLTKQERELEQLKSTLETTEVQYDPSKAEIVRSSDAKKQKIQNQIGELQKNNAELQSKKQELEDALAKTFALAFGKKKELKEQIAATESAISSAESDKRKQEAELTEEENRKNRQINELDGKLADLRKKVTDAEALPTATKKRIENIKISLDSKKESISVLKKVVDDFHADYLIRTYGGKIADPAVQIADKQGRIDQLQKTVGSLRQEVIGLENRIKMAEIEEAEEAEKKAAERKAQQEADAKASAESAPKQETEEEMRARIEAEVRARFEAEARIRAEAEAKVKAEMETKAQAQASTAAEADGRKFKRPYVADGKLAAALDRAFDKLEAYFPEGKVFAFDSIDSDLREKMADLYKRAGYATIDDMLAAYGFEIISGDAVKAIRSFVRYTPGNEPDCIKSKLDNVLTLLAEYYPDHVIPRGLQNDHKSLAGKVSGMCQWLGYEDQKAFLAAYGYEYNASGGGRPLARDYDELVNTLVEKYKNGPKPRSMGELLFDNPELKGALKTLQNKSGEVFGMTLKKYFEEVGVFDASGTSGARGPRTTSAGAQDGVFDALAAVYSKLDENEHGTVENAMGCLEGMNVKRNRAGQIYIFRAVTGDSTVTIPYGIDFISKGAFSGQRKLKEVVISAELSEIPAEAFANCISLERINIPEGITAIGAGAFANCLALESVVLPESLQRIASEAFVNCSGLKEVEFLNPMTIVSDDAFSGCAYTYEPPKDTESTDSEYFNYSMDRKGNVTISGFTGDMETIVIPGMIKGHLVTTIGRGAFQGCKNLVDVSMPDHITTMQGDSFRDCISLKRIHLSNGITKIVTTSFNGCIGLEEINIPDSVSEIKRATFKDSPIKKLHIGKALPSIESKAFYNGEYDPYTGRQKSTRAINKITVDPSNPYLKSHESMVISKDGKTLFAVLGNKKTLNIPDGIETINSFACEGLAFLADVSIPETVVSIGEKAFANTAIRSVEFGPNVRTIGNEAYEACPNLTAAVFNEGLEEIGEKAFAYSPIVSVLLPATLRKLGMNAFNALCGGNNERQGFKIDSSNPYMKADGKALYVISEGRKTLQAVYGPQYHQYIYDNRTKLPEYVVQAGTTHIGPAAFNRCTSIGRVELPEGLLSIGENAFMECQTLTEAELPQSVVAIGENAFRGTSVKTFSLGASVCEIGAAAFITGSEWEDKRTKLRDIKVDKANLYFYVDNRALMRKKPDGSSAIVVYFGGDETFAIPEGVTEIERAAFKRSIVQEVQIPPSVKLIGEEAFSGCTKLVRLRVGLSEAENGASYAVVYIPGTKRQNNYADSQIRDQYMDCIRVDGSGAIFDFVKYDSLFDTISASKDKVLVATDRLKSAIQLVPLYRDKYLAYLRRNAKKAVEIVVEYDDLSGLNTLAELNIFTGKNIDQIIDLANKAKKTEILSFLMNYKNAKIGIEEDDYDL